MKREETRKIKVGNIQIGKQNKVIIQSMTNSKTKDINATVAQINELEENGCQIVRLAVLDIEDAKAIREIKKQVNLPLVADIHFSIQLALLALESGIDKIRINPGNINNYKLLQELVIKCKEKQVPIRIGINGGSLEAEILKEYNDVVTSDAMIKSAMHHVKILEDLDFYDICLSFKSSDVPLTIETYKKASEVFDYPLHLGVTEAGTFTNSAIKSSAALGTLLSMGIGDTMRISVTSEPKEELIIAKQLLRCFDLIDNVPNLVSCPTCGRIQYNMMPIAKEIEEFLNSIKSNITVAIMGCPVNGPQEAKRADIGIAGGTKNGILFKKGKMIKTVPQEMLLETLKEEIIKMSQ